MDIEGTVSTNPDKDGSASRKAKLCQKSRYGIQADKEMVILLWEIIRLTMLVSL